MISEIILFFKGLDKIISESISDNLVGEEETLISPQEYQPMHDNIDNDNSTINDNINNNSGNNGEEKQTTESQETNKEISDRVKTLSQEDNEQKSERSSSGSDQFIIVGASGSGSGSEAEVIDVRVDNDDRRINANADEEIKNDVNNVDSQNSLTREEKIVVDSSDLTQKENP